MVKEPGPEVNIPVTLQEVQSSYLSSARARFASFDWTLQSVSADGAISLLPVSLEEAWKRKHKEEEKKINKPKYHRRNHTAESRKSPELNHSRYFHSLHLQPYESTE